MVTAKNQVIRSKMNGETALEVLPNGQVVWARSASGEPICYSRLRKKEGERCQTKKGLFKNGRCRKHGGKTPTGINSATFKTGAHSKRYDGVLTGSLKDDYERLLDDPDYTSLKHEITITVARLREQHRTYGAIDGEVLRTLVDNAVFAQELLAGEYDSDDVEDALRGMVPLVLQLREKVSADAAIDRTQEQLRKLVDTENKKLQGEMDQIPARLALRLFRAFNAIVNRRVRFTLTWIKANAPDVARNPLFPDPLPAIGMDVDALLSSEERLQGPQDEDVIEADFVETAMVPVD